MIDDQQCSAVGRRLVLPDVWCCQSRSGLPVDSIDRIARDVLSYLRRLQSGPGATNLVFAVCRRDLLTALANVDRPRPVGFDRDRRCLPERQRFSNVSIRDGDRWLVELVAACDRSRHLDRLGSGCFTRGKRQCEWRVHHSRRWDAGVDVESD